MHIDYAVLGGFTLLWLAIVPTPGPNSLLIVHLALTAPWRDVAIALAGNLFGVTIYALGTLFGLALLLATEPSLRLAVYVLGGAYLVWSGLRLVRAGLGRRQSASITADALADGSREVGARNPFLQGVLTALANVAALFFLASIFASAGILVANPATQVAALGVIVAGNGLYLSLLAGLLQRERPRAFYARNRGLMQLGFGVLFVAFGLRLVVRELLAWH
ncbi:MAG: LysE family transporter [Hyphomicrobiaceae bacterium]|nr:LysE family transporter [Hyphomicrobiaceae bacterium]